MLSVVSSYYGKMNTLMLKQNLNAFNFLPIDYFWHYNRRDMVMLIQYGHLFCFQTSENDFVSPIKNENIIISKTKYESNLWLSLVIP